MIPFSKKAEKELLQAAKRHPNSLDWKSPLQSLIRDLDLVDFVERQLGFAQLNKYLGLFQIYSISCHIYDYGGRDYAMIPENCALLECCPEVETLELSNVDCSPTLRPVDFEQLSNVLSGLKNLKRLTIHGNVHDAFLITLNNHKLEYLSITINDREKGHGSELARYLKDTTTLRTLKILKNGHSTLWAPYLGRYLDAIHKNRSLEVNAPSFFW